MLLRCLVVAALVAAPVVRAEEPAPASPASPAAAAAPAATVAGLVLGCGQGFTRDSQAEAAARGNAAVKQMVSYVGKQGDLDVRVTRTIFAPGTSVGVEDAAKGTLSKLRMSPGMKVLSEASAATTVSELPAARGHWEGDASGQRTGLEFAFVADAEKATLWMVQVAFTRKGTAETPASLDDLRAQAVACLDTLKLAGR